MPTIPTALQSRIDSVGTVKDLQHIEYRRNPDTGRHDMVRINCKICGSIIGGPVDSGEHAKTERVGQQTIIYRTQTFSRFALYTEVEIQFDDGSKHVTHLCKQCIPRLNEPGMLERLYVADLAQFVHEDVIGLHQHLWDGLDMMFTRQPIGWTDLGGV